MAETTDEFLAHHGILGMHWGRHLAGRTEASHNPKPKKTSVNPEHSEVHNLAKKPVSSLSTSDIRKVNQRLQAEQQYKQLNPSKIAKGHKAVKTLIAVGSTVTALVALGNTPAGKAAINAGSKAVGNILAGNGKHAVGYVAPVVKAAARHL